MLSMCFLDRVPPSATACYEGGEPKEKRSLVLPLPGLNGCRSQALAYTSFVVSPKMEGLEEEHQSPSSCFTICEIEGKDKAENLEQNCLKLFRDLQRIEDGEPAKVILDGKEELRLINAAGENEKILKTKHPEHQRKFTPSFRQVNIQNLGEEVPIIPQATGRKDSRRLKPKPLQMRVHKQWPMDRECPDAFIKSLPHIKAVPYMVHAGTRITEWLLKPIHEKAILEKRVDALNTAWKRAKCWYRMKKNSETGNYYAPSLSGRQVKRLCASAPEWLQAIDPALVGIWKQWWAILQLARDRDPSQEQREKFGPMCRTFFRCVLCVNTDEGLAYYMHTLAAHGGEYMLYCILGRYLNEALEAHHLISWRQVLGLTLRGGRPGNPFTVKLEDGTFDKSSALHEHTTQSVTKTVMQAQNRLLFPKVAHDLDTTVWEGKGYQKPEPMADLISLFAGHAPKAGLVPERQSLRRLQRSVQREVETLNDLVRAKAPPWRLERQRRLVQLRRGSVNRQRTVVRELNEKVASAPENT
ncbi:hypothetical protein CYMTET_45800 [Cymbomonas tetramitiformis]|uniref:Uncharacterized protein n=1 Tax=Cymbomonas tetramitiformis TaxID=36881 RepID=A0AAE0BYV7_9CHLO|nr:hypothetical protein CYMTET_45800 [Cymbomonas tetramitiformis]